jgi:hypothetical protein
MPTRKPNKKADDVLVMVETLDSDEKSRLFEMLFENQELLAGTGYIVIPLEAGKKLLGLKDRMNTEMDKAVRTVLALAEDQAALEMKMAARNRRSSPEIIRRNVEICDRRKQDRKHWSLVRLARTYKVSKRTITKVLKEEDKWRRLALLRNSETTRNSP